MTEAMNTTVDRGPDPGVQQLRRLGTLTDVVYALVLWRVFNLIPRPLDGQSWNSLGEYFADSWLVLLILFAGLVFTVVYWPDAPGGQSRGRRGRTEPQKLSSIEVTHCCLQRRGIPNVARVTSLRSP